MKALTLLALFTTAATASAAVISNGVITVDVNEYGLLTASPGGALKTLDGPVGILETGFAEWYGLEFDIAGTHFDAAAQGQIPDWGNRNKVQLIASSATKQEILSTARVADLLIHTTINFDADGPYLIGSVQLTNTGDEMIQNIFYTRERISPKNEQPGWTFPTDLQTCLITAPRNVMRQVWMMDDLPPGASTGLGFSFTPADAATPEGGVDVPLSLWTSPKFPTGVPVGATRGLSFGDYDADGYPDMFALFSGNLWRNINGEDWELAANLLSLMPPFNNRYGSSFGDYNEDGLPDIGCEPRKEVAAGLDTCMHLLKNLGGGPNFVDVANDSDLVTLQPCGSDSESICWADVDGDSDMDMFLPVYPAWAASGPGNFFFTNLGPVGPGGEFVLDETSAESGVDNPSSPLLTARPEGAQFVDIDFDGDLDLYSNGTLYQNRSTVGIPDFDAATEAGSGIGFSTSLDEGGAFADYDLDGDYDLYIVYSSTSVGVRLWENWGDGYFAAVPTSVVQSHTIGLNLGLSVEDWDNDGDMDFTTRQVFRRNQLMETGTRLFTVATHTIPASHLTSATPSWGDWDKDGDLDSALGNWLSVGHFYENTLYDESTPDNERRHVRVRVMRDSETVDRGLESEYGTSVEIDLIGVDDGFRRKKFTASAAGYLNQNEYPLHFAVPADPAPGNPSEDLHFDVIVDFPSLPEQGFWRVDKHVNPELGNVNLADLTDREIIVFRSGKVVINGEPFAPSGAFSPNITTAAGGLRLAQQTTAMPAPIAAPTSDRFVGLDFDTIDAANRVRITEIILDGQLDDAAPCPGGPFNMLIWDVTNPGSPTIVPGTIMFEETSDRNRRSYYTTDILLETDRNYRLVAGVTQLRATTIAGPIDHGSLSVNGGLNYQDTDPCSGTAAEAASVSSTNIYMTMRFGDILTGTHDQDADGDVDLADFAGFQLCFTGPDAGPFAPGCEVFDSDDDGDIDLNDFNDFQLAFTGPL
jgi:hypothetical protein